MRLTVLFFSLLLLSCRQCFAQKHAYTLEETLELARKNNFQIEKGALDIEANKELKKSMFTQYFPHASMGAMYFELERGIGVNDVISSIIHSLMSSGEEGNLQFMKRGVTAGVSILQPIFAGGLIYNSNRLADLNARVSMGKQKMKITEVEQEVEHYYWTLVQCYESKRVLSTMDSLIAYATHDANLALKAGLITHNDVLEIGIYSSQLEGVRLLLDNGIDLCKAYLGHLTNQDEYDSIQWNSIYDVKTPVDFAVDHQAALELRDESSLLDMQVEAYRLQKKMTLGMLLPKVFAGFNYGYHNFSAKNDGGFWNHYIDTNHWGWTFMATASVPLTAWWGGSHNLRRSNIKIRQAEIDRTEKRSLMSLQMDLKWKELQRAYHQISISRAQYAKAVENERQQAIAYRSGMITMTSRLQAEALLEKSHTDYVEACVKYQMAISEYRHVTAR